MKILFIHKGFPGQFKHLIPQLQARGDNLSCINPYGAKTNPSDGISYHPYQINRGNGKGVHPLALETETKVLRGEAVAAVANNLCQSGYKPDLIFAHPGWGESLFIQEIWGNTPQLHYVEFAYKAKGTDTDFPDRYSLKQTWEENARVRMKNANVLMNLEAMSWGLTPTAFQKSTLPLWAQEKTSVIHEGIDTTWACPNTKTKIELPNKIFLDHSSEVVTFVNRTFEPYRGIHVFLDAIKLVMKARPNVRIILVGEDTPNVSYGARRTDGQGWLTALKKEHSDDINWSRVYALGKISHLKLRNIFRISSAHVYLTYPFVLSWSMLEAMSCGSLVIGSNTAPVTEIIKHGKNGLLVPFSDSQLLANQIIEVLTFPDRFKHIRTSARNHIKEFFEQKSCIKKQMQLIDYVSKGEMVFN